MVENMPYDAIKPKQAEAIDYEQDRTIYPVLFSEQFPSKEYQVIVNWKLLCQNAIT
jgi:hypothetical protein